MVRDTAEDLMLMEAGYPYEGILGMTPLERGIAVGVVAERDRLRRAAMEQQARQTAFRGQQGG